MEKEPVFLCPPQNVQQKWSPECRATLILMKCRNEKFTVTPTILLVNPKNGLPVGARQLAFNLMIPRSLLRGNLISLATPGERVRVRGICASFRGFPAASCGVSVFPGRPGEPNVARSRRP